VFHARLLAKALRKTTRRKQPHLQENSPLVISSHVDLVFGISCWQQYFSALLSWAMWEHCHRSFSPLPWYLGLLSCSRPWDLCCFQIPSTKGKLEFYSIGCRKITSVTTTPPKLTATSAHHAPESLQRQLVDTSCTAHCISA